MAQFAPLFSALFTTLFFWVFVRIFGFVKIQPFHRSLTRIWVLFIPAYILGCGVIAERTDFLEFYFAIEVVLGFFIFALLHFLGTLYLVGIATRSVSLNLIMQLYEMTQTQKTIRVEDLQKSYAQGLGWKQVTELRIQSMLREGLIIQNKDGFQVTSKAKFLLKLQILFRKSFCLIPVEKEGSK